MSRIPLLLAVAFGIAPYAMTTSAQTIDPSVFSLDGKDNIVAEENFGIINGKVTTRVHYRDVGGVSGLFSPPYASSDFLLEIRLFGEQVATSTYTWSPFEVIREGNLHGISVKTNTVLIEGTRTGVMALTLFNTTDKPLVVPIQFHVQGGLDRVENWEFHRPKGDRKTDVTVKGGSMVRTNDRGFVALRSDVPDLDWFGLAFRWEAKPVLPANTAQTYHIGFEIGGSDKTPGHRLDSVFADIRAAVNHTRESFADKVNELFTRLPRFTASDKRLEAYYYRSLVTLFTNKWDIPEFILQPYYGSGGIIGGCVGNYLWEFGLPAQLFPLIDPSASKSHIKQFLKVDMTKYYLFNPMTGNGGGVWYQVNQDKIVELIYYYVLHTGDTAFLDEVVTGKSVYQHMLDNALFGDDLNKPVSLVDYGAAGEDHLELRRGYPYRGVMPDVNALRYLTYQRAFELSRLTAKPLPALLDRAEKLKVLLKEELWSASDNWFHFRNEGKKDIRWTNFMYTLIGTGVFDSHVEAGLMSHFNDREFLGDYGIHSISKLDPAYDQVDIDHGGGGSYMAFPPLICQRLFNAGFASEGEDLLSRHLWWAERLPYWGDSMVANFIGHREDTPLQSDFDSITGAQTFVFGIFGVSVAPNGTITVKPTALQMAQEMKLQGLNILGKTLDIEVSGPVFRVTVDGVERVAKIGESIAI